MVCHECGVVCQSVVILKVEYIGDNGIYIKKQYSICRHISEERRLINRSKTGDGYIIRTGFERLPNGRYIIKTIPEHRYIWEQTHGILPKDMVIHHINGNKGDNRNENLIAMPKKIHNNHMREDTPFNVTCPNCQKFFQVIRRSKHNLIPV